MFVIGAGLLLVAILGGVGALVSRFRRCEGQERQQVRWLLSAVAFAATVFVVLAPVAVVVDTPAASDAVLMGITTAMLALPLSVAVAILRYRLYDLDRIISRTVSWAVLSGVLAAVYVLAVSLLSDLLPVEGDVAVAASTLVVAALFNPLRRVVQTRVDRRFNRSRYDAAEVAEVFARRLRDAVDLDDLATDLQGVIAATVQPTHLSVWLHTDRD